LRRVVASGKGVHGVEATYTCDGDSGFGASGKDGIGFSQSDIIESVGNGVGRGGAGGDCGEIGTSEAVNHGDLSGGDVGNHFGDEEGVESGSEFFVIAPDLFFECFDAPDARGENNADTVEVFFLQIERCVAYGIFGSGDCQQSIAVALTDLLSVHYLQRVKVFDFAGEAGFEGRSIELRNRSGTTFSADKPFPRIGKGISNGSDGAKTCYNNSFQFHALK